ncbi:MAG TPA: hypothetical protein VF598_03845 [Hymenobacter sp.]
MNKSSFSFEWVPVGLFSLYVLGFVVVSAHLGSLGIPEVNVLSSAVIKAGTHFSLVNLIVGGAVYYCVEETFKATTFPRLTGAVLSCFLGAGGAVIIGGLFHASVWYLVVIPAAVGGGIVLRMVGKQPKRLWLGWLAVSAFVVGITYVWWRQVLILEIFMFWYLLIVTTIFYHLFRALRRTMAVSANSDALLAALVGAICFLSVAYLYGLSLYRYWPAYVGGGRAHYASFYLKPAALAELASTHAVKDSTVFNKPVKVVHQDEKAYYVQLGAVIVPLPVENVVAFAPVQ